MTRRLFTPTGGAVAFAALALLVGGVLGWLTVAALRVEDDQRRAAVRADRAAAERLALWQLDGRLFPVFGSENARPFAHYFPLHSPVSAGPLLRLPSPLLSAELPEWMPLHVHLDPAAGWSSPQVPPPPLVVEFSADALTAPNMTPARRELLAALVRDLPPTDAIAQLVALDEPSDDGMFVPVVLGDPIKPGGEWTQLQKDAKEEGGAGRDAMANRGLGLGGVTAGGAAGPPPRGGLGGSGGQAGVVGPPPPPGGFGGGQGGFGGGQGGFGGGQLGRGGNYLENNSPDVKKRAEAGEKIREDLKGAANPGQQMAVVPPASRESETGGRPSAGGAKRHTAPASPAPPGAPGPPPGGAVPPVKDKAGKALADEQKKVAEKKADELSKQVTPPTAAGVEYFAMGRTPRPIQPPAVHLGTCGRCG